MKITGLKIFVGTVTLCVAAGIVTAFVVVGSPSQERARRMDQQRVNNLQQITYALDSYYALKKNIPDDLKQLAGTQDVYLESINDPQTKQAYDYRKIDETKYELCAAFETAAQKSEDTGVTKPAGYGPYDTMWQHGVGRQCFELQVRTANKPDKPLVP